MTLLTIKEAAVAIRMSEGWVKKAIRDKQLIALRFGRSVRIRPEDLADYLNLVARNTHSDMKAKREHIEQAERQLRMVR